MDDAMRARLRPLLATAAAVLVATACAGVSAAQDETGPAPTQRGYSGPMLSWVGKTPPRVAQPETPAPSAALAYEPPPRYAAPASRPMVEDPAPQSAPSPTPMARADAEPAPNRTPAPAPPPRMVRADPAPSQQAAEAAAPAPLAPVAPAPQFAAPADGAHTGPRFYSLHRAYGLTPDPIPVPTQRSTVLVGPPDRYADPGQDAPGADDAAQPAPHGDGQGADGAGDQNGQN